MDQLSGDVQLFFVVFSKNDLLREKIFLIWRQSGAYYYCFFHVASVNNDGDFVKSAFFKEILGQIDRLAVYHD